MRYRLTIEYQGTRYHGWQGQENARTVQGELLRAGREFFGAAIDIQGSGRTDAGVHAIGQVAHLETQKSLSNQRIVQGLNDVLPPDINVIDACRADDRFHARHHAAGRSYLYQISRRRTAFGKPFVWWVKDGLDLASMRRAATRLTGMRDFAGFTDKRVGKDTSTLVLIQDVALAAAGDLILVRLRASHFLWKMVRRVVGCLVGVGRGEISEQDFEAFFAGPSPYPARVTAPPSGLFLEEVIFPGEVFRRPLEPVLGVSHSREIPPVYPLTHDAGNDPAPLKGHAAPAQAAGRRGGAKGRPPTGAPRERPVRGRGGRGSSG